jgi:hypothetical protein
MRADYDGWEVWNRAFDGPVPSIPIAAALRKERQRGRPLLAFGGADLHELEHRLTPVTYARMNSLTFSALIGALRDGGYRIVDKRSSVLLSPTGNFSPPTVPDSLCAIARYSLLRGRCAAARMRHLHMHSQETGRVA